MSIEKDAEKYVNALRSAPNGWGQHIINGRQSHEWLGKMFKTYGQDQVNNYLEDNYWSKER
jgi:hypothetical protein